VLRLPAFTYLTPRTVAEASEMMVAHRGEAMFVAGGTDLYPNMKRRQFEPRYLIGLRQLPELRGISGDPEGGMTIGALESLSSLAAHPVLRRHYWVLAHAVGSVSTPQLRNMGTLGGNLFVDPRCNYYNQTYFWRHAVGFCMKKDGDICLVARSSPRCLALSSSDSAPVSVALGAEVTLSGPHGERRLPAAELYRDDGIDYLTKQPEDVLTAVHLPPATRTTTAYHKLRRRGSFDFPVLGVAVVLHWDDGVVRDARVALGAVGSRPLDVSAALAPLVGRRPTYELIKEVAQAAYRPAKPLDNADFHHYWRKKMTRVYLERALCEAAGLPQRTDTGEAA
jgi:4-hydroxybenzoyl-CoA reductase subunit beta